MTDKEMIITALKFWFQPGDVFEIRVLDAVSSEWMRPHMESGYFDYDHIPVAAEAVAKLRSYRGVYATVNPVKPDLLARACNRLRGITREPTTGDADILERRWLLIDCDPRRVSGVSSTDAEHEAAIQKARELRDDLAGVGWPEPLINDSGNGAQLMYRIELPALDDGLVQRTIEALTSASTDAVEIDRTVHNPARIWRVPGTMNCKGDSIPVRPHRMARILSAPQTVETVSGEQLRHVAEYVAPDGVAEESPAPCGEFDLDDWIRRHCPELGAPQGWKGGRRWIFPVCPFNDAHANKSAVLIEQPSGAIAFKCHHNGCADNDWRALRELLEPGCYEAPENAPDVDLTGILNQINPARAIEEKLFPNSGPLPDNLLRIPGFIEDVVQLDMTTAPYPNRVLAFTGALALLAFLVGRKVQDKRDNRSNIYLIALADSGTGKDHPRKVNFNLAFRANVANCIGDAFASGEGLEDALFMHPSMLFQADEFDCIFNNLKYSRDERAESMNQKLLKLYGASNSIYPIRKKAMAKFRSSEQKIEVEHIVNPNLVILGTAIPQYFYESLSRRVLENGLVARCVIVEAGGRGKGALAKPITPSDSLLRALNYLVNIDLGGNLSHENPRPLIISETPDATARIEELQTFCDEQYMFFQQRGEASAMALWARAHEKICKLAMLYGISENVYNPLITIQAVDWAFKFIRHLTKRMLYMADIYVYENVFDEKCQKIVRYLRQAGGVLSHSKLLHKSHESADSLKKIIETLVEKQSVEVFYDDSVRPVAKKYRLIE